MQNWKVEDQLKVAHFETVIPHVLVVVSWTSGRAGGWFWFDDGLSHCPAFVWNKNVHVVVIIEAAPYVLEVATGIDRHVANGGGTLQAWKFLTECAVLGAVYKVVEFALGDVLLLVVSHR